MIRLKNADREAGDVVAKFFVNTAAAGFYEWQNHSGTAGLKRLVFQVAKKNKSLEAHLERIHYCFGNRLCGPLFGALIDLLFVLNNNGQPLARRVISGAKPVLENPQFQYLLSYLDSNDKDKLSLIGSRFSIFSAGLLSTATLITPAEVTSSEQYDPLLLARDYIEFSQLDNAIQTLEAAILAQPDRIVLHEELLGLYRSTQDVARLNQTYRALIANNISLPPIWLQLINYFNSSL